ncbi:hypothetical protein ACFWFZ_27175 [Streptomyces sp. NPDC060232]
MRDLVARLAPADAWAQFRRLLVNVSGPGRRRWVNDHRAAGSGVI